MEKATVEAKRTEGEITIQLEHLQSAREQVYNVLTDLRARLTPAMLPETDEAKTLCDKPEPSTPIACALFKEINMLDEIRRMVLDLYERVQV